MAYSVVVISAVFGLAGIIFFGLVAEAYRHVPASVRAPVRHETKRRR